MKMAHENFNVANGIENNAPSSISSKVSHVQHTSCQQQTHKLLFGPGDANCTRDKHGDTFSEKHGIKAW